MRKKFELLKGDDYASSAKLRERVYKKNMNI